MQNGILGILQHQLIVLHRTGLFGFVQIGKNLIYLGGIVFIDEAPVFAEMALPLVKSQLLTEMFDRDMVVFAHGKHSKDGSVANDIDDRSVFVQEISVLACHHGDSVIRDQRRHAKKQQEQ